MPPPRAVFSSVTVWLWRRPGEVTAVLFDKTGTLTQGKPVVAEVWQATGSDEVRNWLPLWGGAPLTPISQAMVGKERTDTG